MGALDKYFANLLEEHNSHGMTLVCDDARIFPEMKNRTSSSSATTGATAATTGATKKRPSGEGRVSPSSMASFGPPNCPLRKPSHDNLKSLPKSSSPSSSKKKRSSRTKQDKNKKTKNRIDAFFDDLATTRGVKKTNSGTSVNNTAATSSFDRRKKKAAFQSTKKSSSDRTLMRTNLLLHGIANSDRKIFPSHATAEKNSSPGVLDRSEYLRSVIDEVEGTISGTIIAPTNKSSTFLPSPPTTARNLSKGEARWSARPNVSALRQTSDSALLLR